MNEFRRDLGQRRIIFPNADPCSLLLVTQNVAISRHLMLARADAIDFTLGRPQLADPSLLSKDKGNVLFGEPKMVPSFSRKQLYQQMHVLTRNGATQHPTVEPREAVSKFAPNDPLSGRQFVYFPSGIPEPRTDRERRNLEHSGRRLKPDVPCLWSPGMHLSTRVVTPNSEHPEIVEVYYRHRPHNYALYADGDLPEYNAWLAGDWFPIPAGE